MGVDRKYLLMIYKTLISSEVYYDSVVYGSASNSNLKRLEVQNARLRVCLGALK